MTLLSLKKVLGNLCVNEVNAESFDEKIQQKKKSLQGWIIVKKATTSTQNKATFEFNLNKDDSILKSGL